MPREDVLAEGKIEKIGEEGSDIKSHQQGLGIIFKGIQGLDAVAHRVVHGGEFFRQPTLINGRAINRIRQCSWLAPLHNPANLAGIVATQRLLTEVPQVAVFDTAFYRDLPQVAYLYGLPLAYYRRHHIRRYGFHGTSHEYVAYEAARVLRRPLHNLNLITCHLGNGCSITAVQEGRAVDTSMGFTPLEGLIMGTRCGDIDPAIVIFLITKLGLRPHEVDELLNKESGLRGISGISNDMRRISELAIKGNRRARLAYEMFIYRIVKYVGSYAAVLGRVDALVFTAGIGENHAPIRKEVTRRLLKLLKRPVRMLVIPTKEELLIARKAYQLI
jgi:acetate kinase